MQTTALGHLGGLRRAAAISSLAGSLLTRWAWVRAGKASADDQAGPLQQSPEPYEAGPG